MLGSEEIKHRRDSKMVEMTSSSSSTSSPFLFGTKTFSPIVVLTLILSWGKLFSILFSSIFFCSETEKKGRERDQTYFLNKINFTPTQFPLRYSLDGSISVFDLCKCLECVCVSVWLEEREREIFISRFFSLY